MVEVKRALLSREAGFRWRPALYLYSKAAGGMAHACLYGLY